ncbi:hypothetical protein MtrunA17_Chr8g0382471 [Medicago truncatula]|uniref:Transmembrane protein n=1 Tax=Medicago truncatula TaxID=3880 RepID=A0A396GTY6_MEDTR|nr:hypothetical protein MtrunA17_Chr8g0382471 [Medicago truncatula]
MRSITFITITPSYFPFLLVRFNFLFLFCCLVLGLLELSSFAFGVRQMFFLGWFEFLMYMVVIFTFGYDTLYLSFKNFK